MNRSLAIPVHRDVLVFRSLAEIPSGFGPSVAAIGNFDGVHLGHQEILSAVVAEARALGARAVAITFDPHPEQILRPSGRAAPAHAHRRAPAAAGFHRH
jgi:FAD synthase